MSQSPFLPTKPDGLHVAIIMDGNGRWAKQRGMPRLVGHRAGTENVRRIVSACPELGIRYLTLYAFSTENWRRPRPEVEGLMRILAEFIERETRNLHAEGVQIRHLGQLEGLPPRLQRKILSAVEQTQNNDRLTLAVALNYGGRADIVGAVRAALQDGITPDALDEDCIAKYLGTRGMPDPDLIVRTSGEFRLSNFLVWQAAYSELWTTPLWWPDFGPEHLRAALEDFGQRERRFGGLVESTEK
ncbi:MAG: Undecaprenyl diphosphate synthase [uncultured Chloroflexia bacterium]|uniref:Isoprenyl transferase n=1 Tax=uncultured Chloroflexia bacterium TaxID=1672391 RepID=A0A6J4N8D3_9CHLR|nr:MAG: Undecaprenyl diphosphate synthase [uncultured Chloroflexia bacterium]